tara:strand:- start:9421 stop:9570 length:150 start_codon:yes stop_codon:yes gene_type:complete
MKKENLMLLFSFFGLLLSGYLTWILHQRVIYLENRDCVIEVRLIGEKNE